MKTKGQVTIPTDSNFINETKEIMAKWGADAVRDCDGTKLPQEIKSICKNIYSTYFVTRGDNNWANNNINELQHYFVMSDRQIATVDAAKLIDEIFNIDTDKPCAKNTNAIKITKEPSAKSVEPKISNVKKQEIKDYILECVANVSKTDYFAKRGLNAETISKYFLGYCL